MPPGVVVPGPVLGICGHTSQTAPAGCRASRRLRAQRLDSPVDNGDPVWQQLRKLREGPGLTAARLAASGAVMSALGTSDPQEAFGRLQAGLEALGAGERTAALAVDFGLDLETHLKRPPTAPEVDWLMERRTGYGRVIGRSVKTLSRWSDDKLAELRASLITDYFSGHLVVMAAVRGDRILGCTLSRYTAVEDGQQLGASQHIDNPSPEPSPPCLTYGFPRDWRPSALTLGVTFLAEPYPPAVWAIVADSFFEAAFGRERYRLPLHQGTALCRIEAPRRDRLYSLWWHDERGSSPPTPGVTAG